MASSRLQEFLQPLHIDKHTVWQLSRDLEDNFKHLSANSLDQFLPTPISESMLRPVDGLDNGRYLAIDIGGTNLRVAFVELSGGGKHGLKGHHPNGDSNGDHAANGTYQNGHVKTARRLLEMKWPIQEHLKHENSANLFDWVGERVAKVVRSGLETFSLSNTEEIPMGVTFSFPMIQRSLSTADIMAMGKGFSISSKHDLGGHLLQGYEKHRTADMPPVRVAAISNDAVSTLVSFIYQFDGYPQRKAAMGLIVGTGSNATIPLKLSSLHASKRPHAISVIEGQDCKEDVKIAVNTEWSINGSLPPLHKAGLVSRWDAELSASNEVPNFQPLEYMTAGRYLGELARLVFVEYMATVHGLKAQSLPARLNTKYGLSTTFISFFYPNSEKGAPLEQLVAEFPVADGFQWTLEHADALYRIAHAIEVRAAGIIAASIIGLLGCAGELESPKGSVTNGSNHRELAVGFTGGCIQFFQNYLEDCQSFLDDVLELEHNGDANVRIVLCPCHDGGILGAGILVPAALASRDT